MLQRRLRSQQLSRSSTRRPADVVAWLGAVQAQDYPDARWALGLRASSLTDADVERAFNSGRILRTHVLRPTWHFVTPADIRWMLALTGPRLQAGCFPYNRRLGLDEAVLKRSRAVLDRELGPGRPLTRAQLGAALRQAGIPGTGPALAQIMMSAELTGVICSGPRQDRQFTYALLDQRAPMVAALSRDEALGELTRRYFSSHGPATLRDYVWWSGLVVADARRGIEIAGRQLERLAVEDRAYWARIEKGVAPAAAAAHLLPNYDEYLVAYRDREAVVRGLPRSGSGPRGGELLGHSLIINGRLAGSWTRTLRDDAVTVTVVACRRLTAVDRRLVANAAERYGGFLDRTVVCEQRFRP